MTSLSAPALGAIPLCEPAIGGNEWAYVKECLDTGWVSSVGAFVDRFERSVAAAAETFARRALRRPRLAYALLAEPVDTAVEAERLVFRRAFRDVFADRIEEGTASGRLPRQDPQLTAAALVGACAEALIGPLSGAAADGSRAPVPYAPGPHTPAHLVAFTLRALGVPRADDA